MVFGQLTSRDSLRDLIVVINAHSKKTYHLGLGKTITRSNLAKANEKRDHKIFEEFAYYLIEIARKKKAYDDFNIEGKVYAFDSSTIDLWAPLKTLLWLLTCSSFQLLRCRNTHLAQLNSVFSALYLKKITALSFQTELLEMPITKNIHYLSHPKMLICQIQTQPKRRH